VSSQKIFCPDTLGLETYFISGLDMYFQEVLLGAILLVPFSQNEGEPDGSLITSGRGKTFLVRKRKYNQLMLNETESNEVWASEDSCTKWSTE
jgi:hypothetical protein